MRMMMIGAAALAIAAAGFSSPSVAQDCVGMINQTQARIGNTPQGGSRSDAQRELDAAHQAYQAGDRSACLRHAERAADMARDRGFSGSSREPDRYDRRRSDDRYYDRRYDDRDDRRYFGR